MFIHELKQPLEVETPLGRGIALFLIDYGPIENSVWVVALETREVKHFTSNQILISKNYTFSLTQSK